MSLRSIVHRLTGCGGSKERDAERARELAEQKKAMREHSLALESGSRVMGTMAGMMRMMTEHERGNQK